MTKKKNFVNFTAKKRTGIKTKKITTKPAETPQKTPEKPPLSPKTPKSTTSKSTVTKAAPAASNKTPTPKSQETPQPKSPNPSTEENAQVPPSSWMRNIEERILKLELICGANKGTIKKHDEIVKDLQFALSSLLEMVTGSSIEELHRTCDQSVNNEATNPIDEIDKSMNDGPSTSSVKQAEKEKKEEAADPSGKKVRDAIVQSTKAKPAEEKVRDVIVQLMKTMPAEENSPTENKTERIKSVAKPMPLSQIKPTLPVRPKIGPKSRINKEKKVVDDSPKVSLVTLPPQPKTVAESSVLSNVQTEKKRIGAIDIVDLEAIISKPPVIPTYVSIPKPKSSDFVFETPEEIPITNDSGPKRKRPRSDPLTLDIDSENDGISQPVINNISSKSSRKLPEQLFLAVESNSDSDRMNKQFPFQCDLCSLGYYSSLLLNQHKTKVHRKSKEKNKPPGTPVNIVKAITHESQMFARSDPIMTTVKNKSCPYCCKAFSSQQLFEIHLITHSEQQLSVCDVCSASFFSSTRLAEHMKQHV